MLALSAGHMVAGQAIPAVSLLSIVTVPRETIGAALLWSRAIPAAIGAVDPIRTGKIGE
jgi:hypothetical protein